MTDNLTTLLHDTAARVPTQLHPAADLRRQAQHHQRVRRAGAGLLAIALLAGAFGITAGLGGGKKRAMDLPAEKPLTAAALLISDELPVSSTTLESSGDGEGPEPVTSCQEGNLTALASEKIWHRSFSAPAPGPEADAGADAEERKPRVRHVAMEFSTAKQAATAFRTIGSWFEECTGITDRGVERYPPFTASGGQVKGLNFSRRLFPDDGHDTVKVEYVSYGLVGDLVTIVSSTEEGAESHFTDAEFKALNPSFNRNPLEATIRFALLRLAGERTLSENAVPNSFRFSEESTGAWLPPDLTLEHSHGSSRTLHLATHWEFWPCANGVLSGEVLASDALRTGMITLRDEDGDYPTNIRQLALYPDARTAKRVVAELVSGLIRCPPHTFDDGASKGTITWTKEPPISPHETVVAWSRTESDDSRVTAFTQAIAIAHVGNSVLLATEKGERPGPQSKAVQTALASIEANVEPVCEIADCG